MSKISMQPEPFTAGPDIDRIHFLSTGHSDAIILESQGHFAMIDAGEDNDYPPDKPNLKLKGYEQEVLAYIKKHVRNAVGEIVFDFVLGTHAHSDHLGGFDTIINDNDVTVKEAFLREYHPETITRYERTRWDNQEVYDQMVTALRAKNIPLTDQFPTGGMMLGNFKLDFFNTEYDTSGKLVGDNDNSIVTRVTKGHRTALLTGDLDNLSGDEQRVARQVGHIDLLKLGHHGYIGSTTFGFVHKLRPKYAVATNWRAAVYPHVKFNLAFHHCPLVGTADNGGIMATFTDSGEIIFTNHIM